MVHGRYNELVNGVYEATYNWGAPSCRASGSWGTVSYFQTSPCVNDVSFCKLNDKSPAFDGYYPCLVKLGMVNSCVRHIYDI
jgi:hypothetical protein